MHRRHRSISSWITEVRRGHSKEEGCVQSGHTRSDEVTVQKREASSQVTRGQARSEYRGGRGPVSSWITEVRRGHSTEEGGVVRSHEVRVRRRQRSISSWITEVRRGHSKEEGCVQSGHTRSGKVRVQRSQCRRGRCPARSQRSDKVIVQRRSSSSQITGQMRSQYRRRRCPVRSHEVG